MVSEDIIKKVTVQRGISKEEFLNMVNEKIESLEGLVSEDGAAHIVANELGVQTLKPLKRNLKKVSEISAGTSFDAELRVIDTYGVREFTRKDGNKGRLFTFLGGDSTGKIRIVLWGHHARTGETLKPGDAIFIHNAYARENRDRIEIHAGNRTRISTLDETDLPKLEKIGSTTKKGFIIDAAKGTMGIKAVITHMLRESSYTGCPECKRKIEGKCEQHNKEPIDIPIKTVVLDDGSGTIIGVLIGDRAEKIVIGEERIFVGNIQENDFTGNIEMLVNRVQPVNYVMEAEALIEKMSN